MSVCTCWCKAERIKALLIFCCGPPTFGIPYPLSLILSSFLAFSSDFLNTSSNRVPAVCLKTISVLYVFILHSLFCHPVFFNYLCTRSNRKTKEYVDVHICHISSYLKFSFCVFSKLCIFCLMSTLKIWKTSNTQVFWVAVILSCCWQIDRTLQQCWNLWF